MINGLNIYVLQHGAKQPVHWFFGGMGLGIQLGTSVWVGLPKSYKYLTM